MRNQQSETAHALPDALEEIRNAQESCQLLLSELAEARMRPEKALQDGGDNPDVVYDRLLRFLGFVLYRIANRLNPRGPTPEFYFWPGYSSIIGEDSPRRIQINPYKFPTIAGGIGFGPKALYLTHREYVERLMDNDHSAADDYDLSDTSLWFDCVLNSERMDNRGSRIIVGGTHQWMTNGQIRLRSDGSPLDVLSVCVDELPDVGGRATAGPDGAYRTQHGRIHISLHPRKFADWGRQIAEVLNDTYKVKARYKWPTPNDLSLVDTFASDLYGANITYRLYGLWLKANFDPSWRENNIYTMIEDTRKLGEWRKSLTRLANGVESLALATVKGPAFVGEGMREGSYPRELLETFSRLGKHEYRYWYTLVLKKTAEIPDLRNIPADLGSAIRRASASPRMGGDPKDIPTELGSAMILSSVELPDYFFHIIKLWIESIYLEIRAVETSILLRDKASLDGQLKQSRQFAHQTSGLITTPWLDDSRKNLSDWSQFSLWMAKTLITQIWGTATVRYDEQIQEDYLEWEGLESREVIERVVNLSLEYAIQRATKASRTTRVAAVDEFNWKFMRQAVGLSFKDDRVPRLRQILGLSLPPDQPMEWMEYKAFVLFFYHALWQASHHALRASFADEGLAPYLWMEWDASSLTIYNRAPSSIQVTVSPKDKEFFKRLSERYREPFEETGPFEVSGPEPIGEGQPDALPVWRTTIHFYERRL